MRVLTGQQVAEQDLAGWAHLGNGLYTRIATPDFATGLALVNAIGEAAGSADNHPHVGLHNTHVDIALVNHDTGDVSERDVALAHTITHLTTAAELSLDGTSLSRINLALDTPDRQGIRPFWRALLAFEDRPGTDKVVRDPAGNLPSVWFQRSGNDEPRQRWHLDVWIDPAQVEPRIEACLAAGGRVVDDTKAPAFWVLADAEGNRSCLATWQGRD
jgi:4a-hydroxytetrahydrobiopterin dehydratase